VAYEPKNHPLFSEQTFQSIEALSQAFQALPRVESVTSILNVPLLSKAGALGPTMSPDDWTWQKQHYSPQDMRHVFDQHPLFTDLLVNQQLTATAIQIVFKPNTELRDLTKQITERQKKVLSEQFTEQDQNVE